jgi:MFS family permease
LTDNARPLAPVDDSRARYNALVLAAAGALGGATPSIVFATVPLAAYEMLGAEKSLATLPLTVFVVGTACGTVPAALLMRRIGRRAGLVAGMLAGTIGSVIAAAAILVQSFLLLSAGAFLLGFAAAFVQQFRFVAADSASPAFLPRAVSWVMAGGIVAAILGPQTVIQAGDVFPNAPFAASYLGAALLTLAAAFVLGLLDASAPVARRTGRVGRPLAVIARQPDFLVAVGCATSAFALMSFVMTAAPLAMVLHDHSQKSAVLGIQWHVLAMFGPSFVTGSLIARFGAERIVAMGLLLLILCALVALAGDSVSHFWLALILLGIGWNFGFIGGTALVTRTYRAEEKERVQALNDFLIFGCVALASFSSGQMLIVGGWDVVNIVVLPVAVACLAALFWQMRRPAPAYRAGPEP